MQGMTNSPYQSILFFDTDLLNNYMCVHLKIWENLKCTARKEKFVEHSSLTSHWHAVAYCETAPPHKQPSGREGKNGGMQGEEHLVFSEFALTGNVIDGRFTPSQAQIWTYTFVFMGLQNGQSLRASGWIICYA